MEESINSPFFTIIIPTIGREDVLSSAITSAIQQDFNDFEVIVVDNSHDLLTTDKIKICISSFQDKRIFQVTTDLYERSNARNYGIDHSQGQYICFLDEDDELFENHLKVLHGAIVNHEYPMAIFRTGMIHLDAEAKIILKSAFCPSEEDPIKFFLDHMVGIHTLCFHKDILQEIRFDPRFSYFEDTHLLTRALLQFPFIQIPKHTCVYHKKKKNINVAEGLQMMENNIACIEDLFSTYKSELGKHIRVESWKKYMLQKKYLDYAFVILKYDKQKSLKLFIKSIHFGVSIRLMKRYLRYGLQMIKLY